MGKVGITVIEGQATTAPDIVPSALTNAGFIFKSYRGPVNFAASITSAFEFQAKFGKHAKASHVGSYVFQAAAANANPHSFQGYGVRVLGSGYAPAQFIIECGSTWFTRRIVGTTGNDATVTVAAGTNATTQRIITIDSGVTQEVFTDVDVDTFEAAINRGVSGINSGVPSELVKITSAGNILPAIAAITNLSGGTTAIAAAGKFVGTSPTAIIMYAGQLGRQDPGAWGNNLKIVVSEHSDPNSRDYTISEREAGVYNTVETKTGVTHEDLETKINGTSAGSKYLYLSNVTHSPDAGQTIYLAGGANGSAVVNADMVGTEVAGTGLYAFDQKDIQLVMGCESIAATAAFSYDLEGYASAKGTVLAISATPYQASLDTLDYADAGVDSYKEKLFKQKSFLACYRGWIKMSDGSGGEVWVPPVGHVFGAGYVRKMMNRNGLPHHAPAGMTTALAMANEVEFPLYSDPDLERLVHGIGINPVMYVPGNGIVVRTSRTFSSLPKNYSAHIRRTMNYLISTFKNSFAWVEQEISNETTRAKVSQSLNFFLGDKYDKGMFETAGGYDNNVSVMCNDQNNPPAAVAARELYASVIVNIVECVESATITLTQVNKSFSVTEA